MPDQTTWREKKAWLPSSTKISWIYYGTSKTQDGHHGRANKFHRSSKTMNKKAMDTNLDKIGIIQKKIKDATAKTLEHSQPPLGKSPAYEHQTPTEPHTHSPHSNKRVTGRTPLTHGILSPP
jgi:hypothetical protein